MTRNILRTEDEEKRVKNKCCAVCEAKLTGRRTVFCSYECSIKYYRTHFWQSLRSYFLDKKMEYGKLKCNICGTTKEENWIVDHKKPIALGGEPLDENNLQILCQKCNTKKTERDLRIIMKNMRKNPFKVEGFSNIFIQTSLTDFKLEIPGKYR